MSGFKLVRDDAGFDVWRDTTTLFTRVYRGHVSADEEEGGEGSESHGRGGLKIQQSLRAPSIICFRHSEKLHHRDTEDTEFHRGNYYASALCANA